MTPLSIAEHLQSDILSGALPPGTPLNQTDIAARFGVSRIPVRDALAQLSADGLIDARPNHTATVLHLSPDEINELFDMRMLLECDLMGHAVEAMTARDLTQIDAALAASSAMANSHDWADGDQMFHAALYAPAGRALQAQTVDTMRRIARVQIAGYGGLTHKTARWVAEHDVLVQLCHQRKTKEAQRHLRKHLRAARNHLMRAIAAREAA
ncbi:MAG: GntR family transcriptional regulator [Roseovarius sp.]